MEFLLGSALAAFVVTSLAARWLVRRDPAGSRGSQVLRAALAFPALAVLLFVVATAVTLVDGAKLDEPGTTGMVVFAFAFFLIYALAVAIVVGVPTALIMVRRFRRA